jgi:molybdopterin-guanine dinucleotide biosynthesis protein A
MGVDKPAVAVGGVLLLDRAVALVAPLTPDLIIVTRDRQQTAGPLRVVADEIPGRGPMAALLTGLRAARYPAALVVPVDLPLLPSAFLRYLQEASAGWDITVPRWRGGVEPLVGVYAQACAPALAAALASGQQSLQRFVGSADLRVRFLEDSEVRRFGDPARMFFNVNTPEDAQAAEALLLTAPGGGHP